MRVGKAPLCSRDPGTASNQAGSRVTDDPSVRRRQSLTSAVTALAAELRSRPKKPASIVLARLAGGSKSTDDLSLANAARSKSCTNLPATGTENQAPLLTLVLGNLSFLDTTISESGERLYVIDTKGGRTNISREDPAQGVTHVGSINWVDDKADNMAFITFTKRAATIQMALGRRYNVEDFLRRANFTSSRLFNLPHYPHALKWKRSAGNSKLTVAKGKTLVAILETAGTTPRVQVYSTVYERDETHPLQEYRGVPVLLLDYLISTALLIAVEKDALLTGASGVSAPSSAGHRDGVIQRWRMGVRPESAGKPESLDSTEGSNSRSPTPDVSSVIDIGVGPSSTESHVDHNSVNSGPTADFTRTQSLESRTRNSQLMTSSTSLPRLPSLSLDIGVHHPFAFEFGQLRDDDGSWESPLASVLPPMLGVSLGDSSPSRSLNPGSFSSATERFTSPDTARPNPNEGYDFPRSIDSPASVETPRQSSSKSLPTSPMRTRRPATADATIGTGSNGGRTESYGRRPYRPLPTPPTHAATLPGGDHGRDSVPPVPPLPNPGSNAAGRAPGSRVVSLSSMSPSHGGDQDLWEGSTVTSTPSSDNNGIRTIRRTASEATLLGKAGIETEGNSRQAQQEHTHDSRREDNDPSQPRLAYRRSIYKHPLPTSTDSPPTISPMPAPIRTYPESGVPLAMPVPSTAPLRIRHSRPATAGATVGCDTSTLLRAPSSSSSHTPSPSTPYQPHRIHRVSRPSEYANLPSHMDGPRIKGSIRRRMRLVDAEGDEDESDDVDGLGAPPAYDTIDFSHPPLRTTSFGGGS